MPDALKPFAVALVALGRFVGRAVPVATEQERYDFGQTLSPAYEGWEVNDDGSFNLVFGYMNRNWEQTPYVPVGPDNYFEPGEADRGQPTYFLPRRNRFVFRIPVPADFGEQELVWTVTVNGTTEKAYATLKRDYYIDHLVVQANYGAGGAAGTTPELPDNETPTLDIEGPAQRTVRVGEPLALTAVSTDDGKPRAREDSAGRRRGFSSRSADYHRHRDRSPALVVRLSRPRGKRHVQSGADQRLGGHAGRDELSLVARFRNPRSAGGWPLGDGGDLQRAGRLHSARHRPRRRSCDDGRPDRFRHPLSTSCQPAWIAGALHPTRRWWRPAPRRSARSPRRSGTRR